MATTLVCLPGESHGQRSLVDWSIGSQWDTTEATWQACTYIHGLEHSHYGLFQEGGL